jgi:3-hydroxyacyl-CoA dehydrogenase/enoyl-CoA hydratase/3-hydroxybutyryl-CoA epimerase
VTLMADNVWSVLEKRNIELGSDARSIGAWKNWRLARDEAEIAWLIADCDGRNVNTLSSRVLEELDAALGQIETDAPRALVIRSGKSSGFFAGADVSEFEGVQDAGEVGRRLGRARDVVERLASLKPTTIAVLHGHVLGGGLELALACNYRIVAGEASLAFPEVKLGLHPGLGGLARLTALIEPFEAMRMALTGKAKRAAEALELGLIDAVTEERHVRAAVHDAAAGKLRHQRETLKERVERFGAATARPLAAGRMRKEAAKKARPEHYPAPGALIDLWERHGDDPIAMRADETASFARLVTGDTAQNLIRLFRLREKMKCAATVDGASIGHVHVIGAGAMGGDIAAWCAWRGFRVSLTDTKRDAIADALKRAAELYLKLSDDSLEARDALDRLIPDPSGLGIKRADIVIEAAPEDLDIKRKLYAELEPSMKPGAVLATNTSSLPLEDLRNALKSPGRLIGLHFFNPVSRMELVELVRHDGSDEAALRMGHGLLSRIDRVPAPVKSAPGFLVNRALMPYMLEAMVMLQEGQAKETIDEAALRFGMPMGPIELADFVGLDICADVADELRRRIERPMPAPPNWLREKIKHRTLGKKTGEGFYVWQDGEPVKHDEAAPDEEMTDRLILPMIDACLECRRKGVVQDDDTVDGALVFGAGFAPFRGGPIRYAREATPGALRNRMQDLAQKYGDRFQPDPGWDLIA